MWWALARSAAKGAVRAPLTTYNNAKTFQSKFGEWFPSETHTANVVAVGGKTTPNSAVLHTALSIAFGMVNSEARLSEIEIKANVDHTANSVELHYSVGSSALIFLVSTITDFIGALSEQVVSALPKIPGAPGVRERTEQEKAEAKKKNAEKALNEMRRLQEQAQIGVDGIWITPKDHIRGGTPPSVFSAELIQRPFSDMQSFLHLTRDDAPNPKPPAFNGLDMRSLVTQVLHDPGIVPPIPKTDKGPPVVVDETARK